MTVESTPRGVSQVVKDPETGAVKILLECGHLVVLAPEDEQRIKLVWSLVGGDAPPMWPCASCVQVVPQPQASPVVALDPSRDPASWLRELADRYGPRIRYLQVIWQERDGGCHSAQVGRATNAETVYAARMACWEAERRAFANLAEAKFRNRGEPDGEGEGSGPESG